MDLSDYFNRLADEPPHGTDKPLTSARLARVLAELPRMKAEQARIDRLVLKLPPVEAALPMEEVIGTEVWRDHTRLSWLWHEVKGATGTTDAEWIQAARAEIADSVELHRNWSIPGVPGPALEVARLETITRSELALIAVHRGELAAHFRALHAPEHMEEYSALKPTDPEAAKWLRQPKLKTCLAGNRFDSAEEAAEFVDKLYAAGAVKVVITTESIRKEGKKELYADAIRVVLPDDPAKRAELFSISNKEAEDEGFDREADEGQEVLSMWWD